MTQFQTVSEEEPKRSRFPTPSWPSLIVTLMIAGAIVLVLVVLNSPLLEVRTVRVSGAESVSPHAIAQLTQLQGENILLTDLDAARQRLLAQPMIRNASVARRWPNRIEVVIVERRPWGRWQSGNTVWPIDNEGVILEGVAPPADGPVVHQVSALPALRAGRARRCDRGPTGGSDPRARRARRAAGDRLLRVGAGQRPDGGHAAR